MPDLTEYAKNLLGRALCGRAPALPTGVYLALGTGGSDAAGLTGEPAGTGYARQRVTFTGTGVQATAAPAVFAFGAAAGTLSHAGLFDAATGGNPLTWSVLDAPVTVAGPGVVTVGAGALSLGAG